MTRSATNISENREHATKDRAASSFLLPHSIKVLVARRLSEIIGVGFLLLALSVIISLLSYNHSDLSFNNSTTEPVKNILGKFGSHTADLMLQLFGVAIALPCLMFFSWAWRLLAKKGVSFIWLRILALISGLILGAIAISSITPPEQWPFRAGLGGITGQALNLHLLHITSSFILSYSEVYIIALSGIASLGTLLYASGLDRDDWRFLFLCIAKSGVSVWVFAISLEQKVRQLSQKAKQLRARVEPTLGGDNYIKQDKHVSYGKTNENNEPETKDTLKPALSPGQSKKRNITVTAKSKRAAAGLRSKDAGQGNLTFPVSDVFQLPPLDILEAPPTLAEIDGVDDNALSQNAELLESVLQDFGVKGSIIKVRPGPVVTLYELEPAPGTKTSRVVGLSDDIARSMSALSVRIAVVPGRSVIGIELPNTKKDTVYFREILASEVYEKSSASLPLILGKDIGGMPMITDLARMPHLLIAGTTGSGKSVAINTMICSLLYQLNPDECKFIMVDPKMLELSVYDGIPHLLSPVVTDPKKAVSALKWVVREMEDRYRLMSQMGVRNINGYNARLAEAAKKGEKLSRRVQIGFDEAGKPSYEDQPLSSEPLPLIVIIVDEMADLMMVAGKDIEGLIQRLAQMARAAGIHLIMATQRPSVDVITGTIKANFPTRISFQVTSKIDSRTILGEQGAEQLLGQGDMLYMAGGGQITRVHGPFVSDEEVEQVVRFLKEQAKPNYIDAVTEELHPDQDFNGATNKQQMDELYDEAVAIVSQEQKASTSLIQRRLQIGYNRAARIIDEMESQEIIGKADRVGRREVLIGSH